jgi:hypothetical protein
LNQNNMTENLYYDTGHIHRLFLTCQWIRYNDPGSGHFEFPITPKSANSWSDLALEQMSWPCCQMVFLKHYWTKIIWPKIYIMTRVIDISIACSTTKFHYLTDFLLAYYIYSDVIFVCYKIQRNLVLYGKVLGVLCVKNI